MALLRALQLSGRRPQICALFAIIFFLLSPHIPSKALTSAPFWTDAATGLAIGGFDPVNYFTNESARRGSAAYEMVWQEVAWRFANEGNMDAFQRDPEVYAPQFGGHGAYGMSSGHSNQGNPQIWEVSGSRLYLFYSLETREKWREDSSAAIVAAEIVWASLQ